MRKIIFTNSRINYTFIIENGNLIGIHEQIYDDGKMYYFDYMETEPKVTNKLLEKALKKLISTNCDGFDLICEQLSRMDNSSEYMQIAYKQFIEYWNKLYNLSIANDVFKRKATFESVNKMYDFFEENK